MCAILVLITSVGLCLNACGSSGNGPKLPGIPDPRPTLSHTSAFEVSDCEFPVPLKADIVCGYLSVPEDRSLPDGPTIRLHVAVFRSANPEPEPDPLFYLHGGPAAGVLREIAFWYEEPFREILAQRDLVVFDQRGVGYSKPNLGCFDNTLHFFESLSEDWPMGLEEWVATHMESCHESLLARNANLRAYTSAASAADIDDLRIALGYDQVNLYGVSYGTRLALTTLRDLGPKGVIRSVILDSVYPLQVDLYAERAGNAEKAFQRIFDACAADEDCSRAYPELAAGFFELIEHLDATPAVVDVLNPITEQHQDVVLNGSRLIETFYRASYRTQWLPHLPRMLQEISEGQYDLFARALEEVLWLAYGIDQGSYYAVQCSEEAPFSSTEAVEAASAEVHPRLSEHFAEGTKAGLATCAWWDAAPVAANENQPVSSDVPALILAGTYDPITPPAWSRKVSTDLHHAHYYEFPAGHGVIFFQECAQALAGEFIREPSREPSLDCLDGRQNIKFAVP